MNQPNLLLLFGGSSYESEISLRSAAALSRDLHAAGYPHLTAGIAPSGEWYLYSGSPRDIESGAWATQGDKISPILPSPHGLLLTESGRMLTDLAVFPCLHGADGEDGRIQGLLDLYRIPYIGSATEASAICINKSLTKDLLLLHHIPMAGKVAASIKGEADATRLTNRAETRFLYPMFVKPSRCGSSVGATIARDRRECISAVLAAARFDETVMVERYIKGRELEIAVFQKSPTDPLLVSPPCEPIYKAEFYDYDAKYKGKGAHLAIPAKLPKHTCDVLRSLAERIFTLLGCRHLARIDFFVGENGEVLFNEINTLPGMTEMSVYPAALAHMGYPVASWLPSLVEEVLHKSS